MNDAKQQKKEQRKKTEVKISNKGKVYITSTFNNTLITITDDKGNVLSWASSGSSGFKGTRKSTPFAAQIASSDAARMAAEHGVRTVSVLIKGPGAGRESALRAFSGKGISVTKIIDVTPVPHNGPRAKKPRRV